MATFFEDPRLRQRWNQISHNAEAVTENAAAGIWTFQHTYVTPCLASLGESFDACTSVCLGDREERARRQRERARGAHRTTRAEYSFDFYDDWYDDFDADDEGGPADGSIDDDRTGGFGSLFGRGFWGSWRGNRAEDWDRLLAGSGAARGSRRGGDDSGGAGELDDPAGTGPAGEIVDQPRQRRSMSYTQRAMRRKVSDIHDDPTVIPSTAPLGFLGRLPFKIGGTLRYKPSSANLREHPTASRSRHVGGRMTSQAEREPLLSGAGLDDDDDGDGHYYHRHHEANGSGSVQTSHSGAHNDRGFDDGDDLQLQYGSMNEAAFKKAGADPSNPVDSNTTTRKRSSTTGSGETSDSFRSRGDLFPSDEEDDEDAVPLDDEFAVALDRAGDDRSSGRTHFSSSSSLAAIGTSGAGAGAGGRRKDKRRADSVMTASLHSSQASLKKGHSSRSLPLVGALAEVDMEAEAPGNPTAADADASYDADTSVDTSGFLLHPESYTNSTGLLPSAPEATATTKPATPAPKPAAELPPPPDEPPDSAAASMASAVVAAAVEARKPEAEPPRRASQEREFVPAMLPRFR